MALECQDVIQDIQDSRSVVGNENACHLRFGREDSGSLEAKTSKYLSSATNKEQTSYHALLPV